MLLSMSAPDDLRKIIESKAILRQGDGEDRILSRGGEALEWIIDLRPLFLDVAILSQISAEFWKRYEKAGPFQLAAMEVAAIPLMTALQISGRKRGMDLNGFIIRKERKSYGTARNIEGVVTDAPVILVDDLLNSGESLERARAVIEHEGAKLKEIFVVIDYESPDGIYWRQKNDITVKSLFPLSAFGLSVKHDYTPPSIDYTVTWRFYEKGAFPFANVPKSTPLLLGDRLVMGLENGTMVCVSAKDGTEIWRYKVPVKHNKGIWSSPAHHGGRIYFGAYNGVVYCLDALTGGEIWQNPCCEWIGSSPLIVPRHNALYIGLEYERPRQKGSHAALNLDTGARLWEYGLKEYEHGSAVYYPNKDYVVFGSNDHFIIAHDAKTGEKKWQHDTLRSIKYAPAFDNIRDRIVAASFDGNIYVLDADTGERLGAVKTGDICYTTPLVTHGRIFAGSGDRHLYIIDADTLELEKKIDCGARVYSSPRLLNGHVVFGTNGGMLIEMDPETLEVKGQARLPDSLPNAVSASPDGRMLYVSTHMNELYGIERKLED